MMKLPGGATIICFGDSITHSGSVEDESKRWPLVVEKRLHSLGHDVTVVASGVPGQTTDGAVKRIEKDVIAPAPDLVIIEFGCNDFWKKDGVNRLCPVERFTSNIKSMIDLIRDRTDAHVALIRNHARSYYLDARAAGEYEYEDEDHGEAIMDIAAKMQAPVIDLFTAFLESCDRSKELYKDSIHLRAAGSLLYAKIVGDWLVKHVKFS